MLFAGAVTLLYVREVDPDSLTRLRGAQRAPPPLLYAYGPGQ